MGARHDPADNTPPDDARRPVARATWERLGNATSVFTEQIAVADAALAPSPEILEVVRCRDGITALLAVLTPGRLLVAGPSGVLADFALGDVAEVEAVQRGLYTWLRVVSKHGRSCELRLAIAADAQVLGSAMAAIAHVPLDRSEGRAPGTRSDGMSLALAVGAFIGMSVAVALLFVLVIGSGDGVVTVGEVVVGFGAGSVPGGWAFGKVLSSE